MFGSRTDVLVTGILEQAIRSSFNFARRELRAEAGLRLTPVYSLSGRYSFERTELFDERFTTDEDQGLIDRLFPQVRLSILSSSFLRDTRDDLVDAVARHAHHDRRPIWRCAPSDRRSGFVKTYFEAFSFRQLPTTRRAVLALGARLGLANGFPREVHERGRERRAGGDLRGRHPREQALLRRRRHHRARLLAGPAGRREHDQPAGISHGRQRRVILNGEMRVGVVGPLQAVGFMDAGNVVARASELRLSELRTTAGFGIRYRSPVGPIRLDLGFKLDRRELSPGRLERRSVWHISMGQAF